jgi:hypothetical protein
LRATNNVTILTLSLLVLCPSAYAGESLQELLGEHVVKEVLGDAFKELSNRAKQKDDEVGIALASARLAKRIKSDRRFLADRLSEIDPTIRERVIAAVKDLSADELSLVVDRELYVQAAFRKAPEMLTPSHFDDATRGELAKIANSAQMINEVRSYLRKRVEAEMLASLYAIPVEAFALREALQSALTHKLIERLNLVAKKDPLFKVDTSDGKLAFSKSITIGPVEVTVGVSLFAVAAYIAKWIFSEPSSSSGKKEPNNVEKEKSLRRTISALLPDGQTDQFIFFPDLFQREILLLPWSGPGEIVIER